MNTAEYIAAEKAIIDGIDEHSSAHGYFNSLHRSATPLRGIVARVVALTGSHPPMFVDAVVEDQNGPSGSLVVVTHAVIARASFETTSTAPLEITATVEAVPRSAVLRVASTVMTAPADPTKSWPLRAQIRVDLDRDLTGERSITIPATDTAYGDHAVALAELAAAALPASA